MKIFEWMQNRINGSNGKNKRTSSISSIHYTKHEPCKQEFSDWPQALLAIGTFGSNTMKEDSGGRSKNTVEDSSSFKDCKQEITLEEVANLQNEFCIFFKGRVEPNLGGEQEEHTNDLTKDCLNSEHSEAKENESLSDGSNAMRGNFYPSKSIVFSRGKDYCLDHSSKRGVGKKSLSFLLKKMLACKSGFQPTPLFKDPLSTESRMEKILRAILHKKIYPQGSCSTTPFINKYLEATPISQFDDDEDNEDGDDEEELATVSENGSKWVKTDSEYIVLEI
ncbi:hypothetical protein VIGAN_02298900 [Vigna angularis var. angularis]|uniref:Uncharacterized protein n=2 Tax=Phaseolus angularis TaxID=3914 RepID=A0A0S3RHR8_PHAAN|nr:protein NEGATIVE GRAVITROPIC RESPONSE OF ROOTS isoform X1 [Vigna angularis]BAT80029.1 hypothetical protein VIGAN_02298900 [Vigna angularis var. angularis]